jgi:predicted Zn-dependent protease
LKDWLTKNPDSFGAEIELVNYYILSSNRSKAEAALLKLVKRSPNSWLILNNLADLHIDKNPKAAVGYAERAYKLHPTSPPVTLTLVESLLETEQDPERATKLVQSLAKRFPTNVEIVILLAKATKQAGDHTNATQILEEFIADNPDLARLDKVRRSLAEL